MFYKNTSINNPVLQSSIEEIATSISSQNVVFGEIALQYAKELISLCPEFLYSNIDEMVKKEPFSDIPITKHSQITANYIKKNLFANIPADYYVLKALILEARKEDGIIWLLDMLGR